jgi:MFS transporter, DHA1 family, inner membrane transport protein
MTRATASLAGRIAAFADAGVNRITVHATLHRLAWGGSGVFSGLFLLRQGVSLAGVFLTFAAIFACRFVCRPLVLVLAPRMGLRRLLILGTLLQAAQYPALALVNGVGWQLVLFGVAMVLGGVIYWTCFHAIYAEVGDSARRGSQVGARQVSIAAASVLGPALGGIMLSAFGAWPAFGTASAIEIAAIIPLFRIAEPPFDPVAPSGFYAAARTGILLFATDGWLNNGAIMAWNLIMFLSLGSRFDAFGGAFAAAVLAGSLAGLAMGRVIDKGHARRVAWANAALLSATLVAKALCGTDPVVVVAVAIGSTLVGGLYSPSLMTAFYNEGEAAPCAVRYQIAAEGGWDIGGALVGLVVAACCAFGWPLQAALLLGLPMVAFQAWLLNGSYGRRGGTSANKATA